MNRHDRRAREKLERELKRKAVAANEDAAKRAAYSRGAAMHFQEFQRLVALLPEPPRFAFLPKDIALGVEIDQYDVGHKLARNPSAHAVVNAMIAFAERAGIEPPTYMMLRAFVDLCKLAIGETIALTELGIDPDRMVMIPNPRAPN